MYLQEKIKSVFPHQVVRKGISNSLKTSIKLPVYVLEYLISQYADQGLSDEEVIEKVKAVLNKHYIMPEDKNKIKDAIKTDGSIVIIDKLMVDVDLNKDMYIGTLNTAGLKDILVDEEWIRKYKGLLEGGMWGLVRLERNEDSTKFPVIIGKFTTRLGSARNSTARLYNVLNSLSRNGGINEVAHQLSINNLEGLSASSFFTKIASFVCPDGGPNDEGMARSAYFDTIAEDQMLYEKKIEELTAQDCMSILQKYMSKVIMEHIKNDIANKIIILPNDINEISRIEGSVEQLIQQSVADACAEVQQNNLQMTNTKAEQITDSIYKKTYEILEGQGE